MNDPVTTTSTTAEHCDRSLAAIVSLTTHCGYGAAIRWKAQGYLRRDWLLFVPSSSTGTAAADALEGACDLDCDIVGITQGKADEVPLLHVGLRLWDRWLWRGPLRLWRDDIGGRCCLVPVCDMGLHHWLQTGRIVAHEGLPWRDDVDRDLGYARAAAAYRRLVREG